MMNTFLETLKSQTAGVVVGRDRRAFADCRRHTRRFFPSCWAALLAVASVSLRAWPPRRKSTGKPWQRQTPASPR